MKSGNIIDVPNVLDFDFKSLGGEITYLKIEQTKKTWRKLYVGTINLGNIEAIMEIK